MTDNRIREFRKHLGMTQRSLAQAAGTSQQQIQRIESGVQDARFDLAVRICSSLQRPMGEVFPSTARALKATPTPTENAPHTLSDALYAALEDAGLDMDPRAWLFKFRLDGGYTGQLWVNGREKRRLLDAVRSPKDGEFIVFDTDTHRYAINPEHLIYGHFMFEAASTMAEGSVEEPIWPLRLALRIPDSADPVFFEVEGDAQSLADDPDSEEGIQLQNLFYYFNVGVTERMSFADQDGEKVVFNPKKVSMVWVPLRAVDVELRDSEHEGEDEDRQAN